MSRWSPTIRAEAAPALDFSPLQRGIADVLERRRQARAEKQEQARYDAQQTQQQQAAAATLAMTPGVRYAPHSETPRAPGAPTRTGRSPGLDDTSDTNGLLFGGSQVSKLFAAGNTRAESVDRNPSKVGTAQSDGAPEAGGASANIASALERRRFAVGGQQYEYDPTQAPGYRDDQRADADQALRREDGEREAARDAWAQAQPKPDPLALERLRASNALALEGVRGRNRTQVANIGASARRDAAARSGSGAGDTAATLRLATAQADRILEAANGDILAATEIRNREGWTGIDDWQLDAAQKRFGKAYATKHAKPEDPLDKLVREASERVAARQGGGASAPASGGEGHDARHAAPAAGAVRQSDTKAPGFLDRLRPKAKPTPPLVPAPSLRQQQLRAGTAPSGDSGAAARRAAELGEVGDINLGAPVGAPQAAPAAKSEAELYDDLIDGGKSPAEAKAIVLGRRAGRK